MADILDRPDVVTMPTADEIFGCPEPPIDPAKSPTRDLLQMGIDLLTCTTDPLAAKYLERALAHIADLADDLAVTKLMLSESQTVSHGLHVDNARLRQRVTDLLELARAAREAA